MCSADQVSGRVYVCETEDGDTGYGGDGGYGDDDDCELGFLFPLDSDFAKQKLPADHYNENWFESQCYFTV